MRAESIVLSLALAMAAAPARSDGPLTFEALKRVSAMLQTAVVRVGCDGNTGSGFVHASGSVVTAAHVVLACGGKPLWIVDTSGELVATLGPMLFSLRPDVAVMTPAAALAARPLALSSRDRLDAGAAVVFAGFPRGHSGSGPLVGGGLVRGYAETVLNLKAFNLPATFATPPEEIKFEQLLFAADVDYGNSGGPLVDARSGEVIGLVVNMLIDASGMKRGIGGATPVRKVEEEIARYLQFPKPIVPTTPVNPDRRGGR